ncbi:hypothetical protein [Leptospira interrogans]|uniref:Uncharacterized protein n=1 Tax=Leptospira interrogans TaxID=173 RepID=A0AAV9G2E7_LEPIR|nr:hypothetical protein [Leptospira interrogans]KAK2620713.1 hypothetical protein CFV95_017725 [Leptospira interrogans]
MSANTFSIESNSKTTEDVGKLNTTLFMNRVGKLNTTLSYGSRCGAGTSFTEDLS